MKKLFTAVMIFTPTLFAFAAAGGGCNATSGISQSNFKCVVGFATSAINSLVIVLLGIGLLVFLWGMIKYIIAGGDEDKTKEAKHFIVFGLIAFFVMFSVWGIVNVLVAAFFGDGGLIIPQIK